MCVEGVVCCVGLATQINWYLPHQHTQKKNTQKSQEDVIAFLGPSQSAICVAPKPLPGQPPTAYVDLAGFAKAATGGGAAGAQGLALFENAARQMDNALGQVCVGVVLRAFGW